MDTRRHSYLHVDHSGTRSGQIQTRAEKDASHNEGKEPAIHQGRHVVLGGNHVRTRRLQHVQQCKGEGA